ncbi:MAG: DsrE family protein [Xanthomonadales bacterium]|nr:DsrE family protein [Xanthomonadales bacterium]
MSVVTPHFFTALLSLSLLSWPLLGEAENQRSKTNSPKVSQKASMGPLIENYGPVFDVPQASFPLNTEQALKTVFDVGASPDDKTSLNRRLESVARYMNMHARAGYSAKQMDIAVVLHGAASWNALSDTAYQQRFGDENPNTALIKALKDQGVSFWLCGQSAGFNGIAAGEVSEQVGFSLSAMTALQQLQSQGYALLP